MRNLTKIFTKLLVFFAVTGIVFILTLINTKLLLFLNWYEIGHEFDRYFAIISGIAYALGSISVVIWYNPKLKYNATKIEIKQYRIKKIGSVILKLSFVILDGIHVFVYQNLTLEEKYIPAIASVVFALQTVLILYFIGSVVDDIIKNQTDNDNSVSEFENLQSKLQLKQSEFDKLKTDFNKVKQIANLLNTKIEKKESQLQSEHTKIEKYATDLALKKSEFRNLQTDFDSLRKYNNDRIAKIKEMQTDLKQKNKHIDMLEGYFYKSEKSRILKKNEANRTEEEIKILAEAESKLL